MSQLHLLTINDIRTNYWNKKTKTCKPIKYYSGQTSNGKLSKGKTPTTSDLSPQKFTPNGTLVVKIRNSLKTVRIENWLDKYENGPYKKDGDRNIFCYLEGKHQFYGDNYLMQICQKPLNCLSEDCMDEVNCWIPIKF